MVVSEFCRRLGAQRLGGILGGVADRTVRGSQLRQRLGHGRASFRLPEAGALGIEFRFVRGLVIF